MICTFLATVGLRSELGTVPSSFGNHRAVPDVAMEADPVTGMLVGQTFDLPSGNVFVQYATGGSSLAAPLFALLETCAEISALGAGAS